MKTKHHFSKMKKHASSRIIRHTLPLNTEKPKYPELAEKIIQISDIIIEVLDARFIQETRNIELEEKINKLGKKLIYVFNKSDLIDVKKMKAKEVISLAPRVFVSCISKKGGKELRNKIKITSYRIEKPVDARLKKVTVGIIGYPNTGKSSLINLLVGKPAAGTGADAGFTKGIQKVNLTSNIVLIDSPGVISKKDYSDSNLSAISKHTKVGARSYSQIKSPTFIVSDLVKEFPKVFDDFYVLDSEGDSEVLIEKLGRKKHILKKGNEVDEDKTARLILKDWQEGRIRR